MRRGKGRKRERKETNPIASQGRVLLIITFFFFPFNHGELKTATSPRPRDSCLAVLQIYRTVPTFCLAGKKLNISQQELFNPTYRYRKERSYLSPYRRQLLAMPFP